MTVTLIVSAILVALVLIYYKPSKPKPELSKYFVDERPACVVVRKKVSGVLGEFPDVDPKHEDVVAYWAGTEHKVPDQIVTVYNVEAWKIKKAHELCRLLNNKEDK